MHFEEAACLQLSVSNSENWPNGSLERDIGAVVAALVSAMCRGLLERQDGQMRPETRNYGSELICKLIKIKLCVPDFGVIARKYGAEVLRAHVAASPDPMVPNEAIAAEATGAAREQTGGRLSLSAASSSHRKPARPALLKTAHQSMTRQKDVAFPLPGLV